MNHLRVNMGISVCNEPKKNNAKLNKDRQKQLKKDLAHFKKKSKKFTKARNFYDMCVVYII